MLLVLTGSSCAGKSTLAFAVADRFRDLAVHDFDEVGVPAGADRRWRQRTMERWVRRALEYQGHGVDLLLTAQSPLGEILAVPSATLLDGIAVCLVDVADEVRRDRLAARDPGRWDAPAVDAFLGWATGTAGTPATPVTAPTPSPRTAGRRWPGTGGPGGPPPTHAGVPIGSTPATNRSGTRSTRSSGGSATSATHTGPATCRSTGAGRKNRRIASPPLISFGQTTPVRPRCRPFGAGSGSGSSGFVAAAFLRSG